MTKNRTLAAAAVAIVVLLAAFASAAYQGNNPAYTDGAPTLVASPIAGFGSALESDGSNHLATDEGFSLGSGAWTFEYWLAKPIDEPAFSGVWDTDCAAQACSHFILGAYGAAGDNAVLAAVDISGGSAAGLSGGEIADTDPHHLALTFDTLVLRLYLDGTLLDSAPVTMAAELGTEVLRLGAIEAGLDGNNDPLVQGTFVSDEYRASNVARYIAPTVVPPSAPFVVDGSTIALWHMDELCGSFVPDEVGQTGTGCPTGPSAPQSFQVVAGDESVQATWQAPSTWGTDVPRQYRLLWTPGGGDVVLAEAATSYQVTGLTNGVQYTFTLEATTPAGTAATAALAATPMAGTVAPSAPQNVTAMAMDSAITVMWDVPQDWGTGASRAFLVHWTGGQSPTLSSTADSYQITGLTNGVAYTVSVEASTTDGSASSQTLVVEPSATATNTTTSTDTNTTAPAGQGGVGGSNTSLPWLTGGIVLGGLVAAVGVLAWRRR